MNGNGYIGTFWRGRVTSPLGYFAGMGIAAAIFLIGMSLSAATHFVGFLIAQTLALVIWAIWFIVGSVRFVLNAISERYPAIGRALSITLLVVVAGSIGLAVAHDLVRLFHLHS